MNEESTLPDDGLEGQALLYAVDALDESERMAFETCLSCPHSRAKNLVAEYRELLATLTVATLDPCPPPAPELKAKIFAAIHARSAAAAKPAAPIPYFLMHDEKSWTPTPYPGVRTRELSTASPEFAVIMVALDPGATFPSHEHHGSEDVYILSGDAHIEGHLLQAGDFMHSEPGSHHEEMNSPSGCRAIIVTSRKNYSPLLSRAYGMAHRVAAKVGKLLKM